MSDPSQGLMRVLIGAEPLIGRRTGIGQYTWQLLHGLAGLDDVSVYAYASRRLCEQSPFIADAAELRGRSGLRRLRSRLLGTALGMMRLRGWVEGRFFRQTTGHLAGRAIYHEPNYVVRPFDGPCVATLHDLTWLHYPGLVKPVTRRWLEDGIPRTLAQARHFIAVSQFVARELTTHLGIPSDKISVTPLGVDARFHPRGPEAITGALAELGLEPGRYLLSVATAEPRKNLLGLLRAFERLPARLQTAYPLVLAGAPGWHGTSLDEPVGRLARRGSLLTLGYVDDRLLPPLYAGARAFAFPAFYEGFGLPPLEAMASGVPVLTSDRSAMAEVCGEGALLVNPEDLDGIREGLERVLTETPLRQDLTAGGLVLARSYTWDRTVLGTLDVYRKVLAA